MQQDMKFKETELSLKSILELVEPLLFPRTDMLKCQVNSQLFTEFDIGLSQEPKTIKEAFKTSLFLEDNHGIYICI